MMAGTLISVVTYPLDTLKRIAQLNGSRAALKLYKTEGELLSKATEIGLRGLYRGVGPFCLSQVTMAYFQFTIFEAINFNAFQLN